MRNSILSILLTFILVVCFGSAAPAWGQDPVELPFAEYLLSEGEYYRAMTEFLRIKFRGDEQGDSVLVGIGVHGVARSLIRGTNASAAADWLYAHRDQIPCNADGAAARDSLLRALLHSERSGDVLHLLTVPDQVCEIFDESPDIDVYKGVAYVQAGLFDRASREFAKVDIGNPNYARALTYSTLALDGHNTSHRSPGVAALLGLVPGAGYAYSGHWKTATSALVVNGVLIGATVQAFQNDAKVLGVFLAAFAGSWYASSIIGSARAAVRFNSQKKAEFVAQFSF